jgi:hypothetical protein
MKIIIYILLFLLAVSIANNYILHNYQTKNINIPIKENTNLIYPSQLPSNVGIASIYVFYNKDKKYDKCLASEKNDVNKQKNGQIPLVLIKLKEAINEIYKKTNNKCYIILDENNKNMNLNNYVNKALQKIA